jgi:signal transduction histidine kinase
MGLQIMSFRARMIGGSLQVQRRDSSGGTIVTCTAPLT